jgi:hypothetical protein
MRAPSVGCEGEAYIQCRLPERKEPCPRYNGVTGVLLVVSRILKMPAGWKLKKQR